MKILVSYFSQSGNTEKIARAIWEEAGRVNDVECKKVEEINSADLAGYDFIFIGSPLHSGNLASPVKDLLTKVKAGSNQKMAGFITHFAPAYPEQDMERFAEPIQATCKEYEIEYKGCFDCQGALAEAMHEAVKKKLNLSDDAWADMAKQMAGTPNEEDVAKAKEFAREVLG